MGRATMPLGQLAALALCIAAAGGCSDDPEVIVVRTCDGCGRASQLIQPGADGSGAALCVGDNDGVIASHELPVVLGAVVQYRATEADRLAPVDRSITAPQTSGPWDLSGVDAPVAAAFAVRHPETFWWYPAHFPMATSASPIDVRDPSIVGVLRSSEERIELLGIASAEPVEPAARTLLVYDPPVALFELPLRVGQRWQTTTRFRDARLAGAPQAGSETWSFEVDAAGPLELAAFRFENTLRLRLHLEQRLAISQGDGVLRSVRYFFLHECVGEVARVVSPFGQIDPVFDEAAEVRILGLP